MLKKCVNNFCQSTQESQSKQEVANNWESEIFLIMMLSNLKNLACHYKNL